MALFTLVSASGSPGVTATALGMALHWPRPVVLVEADPTGGSGVLGGYFRGGVDHPGLMELVMAHRSALLAETLPRIVMPVEGSQASILVGSKSHEQAAGLARLWDPLLGVLREVAAAGQDVLVDAGRLGLASWPRPLVADSDLTLLVTRSTLPSLVAARSWAGTLAEDVLPGHAAGVLLVGEGRPYNGGEISKTLGLPVVGSVAWDPRQAAVFSEGADKPKPRLLGAKAAERVFAQSGYVTSLQAAGEAMRKAVEGAARDPLFRGIIAARRGEEARS